MSPITDSRPVTGHPTVSVVIPCFNAAPWITEALQSVHAQTRRPEEIVVADDASTDGTADLVAAAATSAPVPVHLVRRPTNSGSPAPTLNLGVASATGDFIAVLDQDDVFLPTKLEDQARVLAGHPDMAFVFSLFGTYGALNPARDLALAQSRVHRIHRRMTAVDGHFQCDGPVALEEFARSVNYVGGFPGFLFRRSDWERKGGFDERLVVASDYEFLCWLCTQGTVGFIPELHYRRREHGENLTSSGGIQWRLDASNVMLRYLDFPGTPGTRHAIGVSVQKLLWDVAKRLGSAGQWDAAHDVSATLSRIAGRTWKPAIQRPWLRLYAAYRAFRRMPWQVSPEQADEAVGLAERTAHLLG